MMNVIPPDHVDEVHVVEPNQYDDVSVVPEPVLVDEDEDPKEDEFKEEEDPQEEDDDMEIDIEEKENEPELTYPYEEVDHLNPSPPASESEPDDEIEVENPIEHEDETIPASVHEVGESSTAPFLQEDSDSLLHGLIRRDINSLFCRMASISRRLCGRETVHPLVEKKGKAKDKFYGKLILELEIKKELDEARFSNTFLRMQNERVKRDLYWTRVQAHEFYQEMIHGGLVFEERPNEAINVPIEDEIMPLKSAPMIQAAIRRMIKDSVDAVIAVERARQANVRNDATGSGPARGQDATLAVRECTFTGFMKCNPAIFHGVEEAVELRRWFEKTESLFEISECTEGKKVKFAAATLEGPALTWWKTKYNTPCFRVIAIAPPSPDYIPGPEEPEQAPPLPDYLPRPEHADDEIVSEDQPYAEDASPTAQSPEYVPESNIEAHLEEDDDEDPEEGPVDYPVDGGDDGDDEERSSVDDEDDDMDIEADEEEEEEHPAPADSAVSTSHSPPLPPPFILSPTRSDVPSSGIPPPLPISAFTSSPPLQLPSATRREDRPEVTLPPRKRLGIALGPRYEVGESSYAAAARPAGGLRADYGCNAPLRKEDVMS
nr:hypothetical protein [Tanacetum cinerariifolium]